MFVIVVVFYIAAVVIFEMRCFGCLACLGYKHATEKSSQKLEQLLKTFKTVRLQCHYMRQRAQSESCGGFYKK
jgi:hypothetical protein